MGACDPLFMKNILNCGGGGKVLAIVSLSRGALKWRREEFPQELAQVDVKCEIIVVR